MRAIFRWLLRLLGWGPKRPMGGPKPWPTKDDIARMPVFEGLDASDIVVVATPEGAERAHDELMQAGVIGFDTESQPTFIKGQVSTGPHVVQFSTLERAFIFQLHHEKNRDVVRRLMTSEAVKKVGFGLSDDLKRIPIKLKVQPKAVVDLESLFIRKGYGRGVGVKVAVAIVFKRRFLKSKKASTSSWHNRQLTDKQLLYAANDAYAPIKIFHKFN